MVLNVAAALKRPSELAKAVIEEEFEPISYAGRVIRFEGPVKLEFDYSYDGKAFTLAGTAHVAVHTNCARCDEPIIETLGIPFEERFVRGEEEESYAYEGDTLCLDTMALDNIFLHMPLQSVCAEECRGLCPVCGCNLNTAECGCVYDERENPFAALGSLYDDNPNPH